MMLLLPPAWVEAAAAALVHHCRSCPGMPAADARLHASWPRAKRRLTLKGVTWCCTSQQPRRQRPCNKQGASCSYAARITQEHHSALPYSLPAEMQHCAALLKGHAD